MKILLIDNYDSFTFNIYQYLLELGHTTHYYRNDEITIDQIRKLKVDAIFLSPGPKAPQDAGICLEVVRQFYITTPIFGICLGHQVIAQALGGKVVASKEIYHGKVSKILAYDIGIMRGLREFNATRYHSLAVAKDCLPSELIITAETENGEIMALKHRDYPIESVQFHPESILTPIGKHLIEKFLDNIQKTASSTPIKYRQIATTIESSILSQNATRPPSLSSELGFYDIFTVLYNTYGKENVCLLDSASGLQLDNAENICGIHPKFDIILRNGLLEVQSQYPEIKQQFIAEFSDIYQVENDTFAVNGLKFSDYFSRIRQMFQVQPSHNFKLAYSNGLIGYFSYEYLHYLEQVDRQNLVDVAYPDLHLTYYAHTLHTLDNQLVLVTNQIVDNSELERQEIEQLISSTLDATKIKLEAENIVTDVVDSESLDFISQTLSHSQFIERANKAKQYIVDGDIFQVQLSIRRAVKCSSDTLPIYTKLRQANPSPYMFLYSRNGITLISNSPELQLKVEDGEVLIRPIAGTSKGKGTNPKEREAKRKELINNPKEQAEHIMLVDLARNDIGKWCKPGSVSVDDLLSVAEYANVFHIVSSVRGMLRDDVDSMCIFESTFPAGTLTGAPKVRAMEIIDELEEYQRGVYGGAFGFFDFSGNILSSIIIRTVVQVDNLCYIQSAAGIVYDSDVEDEYQETLHKTKTLKQVLANVTK